MANRKELDEQASSKTKQFISPNGEDIRVTHPDGGVAVIGSTPKTLPPKFWTLAVREGAEVVGESNKLSASERLASQNANNPDADSFQLFDRIKQAIEEALDEQDNATEDGREMADEFKDAFTANGIPQVRWLEKRVGFSISADQRDQAWDAINREAGENDSDDDAE